MKFGTGSIEAKYVYDQVCFGDLEEVCISEYGFLTATHMTNDPFDSMPFDGILGLGFIGLSITKDFNFLY